MAALPKVESGDLILDRATGQFWHVAQIGEKTGHIYAVTAGRVKIFTQRNKIKVVHDGANEHRSS